MTGRKFLSAVLLVLICGAYLLSCNGDLPVNVNFKVSPAEITFKASGGSAQITLTSPVAWEVTTTADWLSFAPSSGEAGQNLTVVVTALENTSKNQRAGTAIFSVPTLDQKVSVALIQEAAEDTPGPDPEDPTQVDGFDSDIRDWQDDNVDFNKQ